MTIRNLPVIAQNAAQVTLRFECVMCHRSLEVIITRAQYDELMLPAMERRLIQEVLNDHPPAVRELFMSSTCDACFKTLFAGWN